MATYDPYSDSPFKIKHEGQEIVVTQNRLSPTTIRISWTLPRAVSCQLPTAYNGALVTIDRTPTSLEKLPTDGSKYQADPTADIDLNAGDKLGTALVVGAFYNDLTTTYVDVTDASVDQPFYASVHAVDAQFRYHIDGVHSYSLPYGRKEDLPTAGFQLIKMGVAGVTLDTPTSLNISTDYNFRLHYDDITPDSLISFHGLNAVTYGDLIKEINDAIILAQNPTLSAAPPGAGGYWIDVPKKLVYKNNSAGNGYTLETGVTISAADPTLPAIGAYWYRPSTDTLTQWNGTLWVTAPMNSLGRDPRNPFCNDYWTDGTLYYKWNGGAWVVQRVIRSDLDPQLPPIMTCGMYWYTGGKLYNWDDKTCKWVFVTNDITTLTGDIRYNTTTNQVEQWDTVDLMWIPMTTFDTITDPSLATIPDQGTIWIDTIDGQAYNLDGTSWVAITAVKCITKPQFMADGAIWHNTHDTFFYKMQMGLWTRISPVTLETTPNVPAVDQLWYNPSAGLLMKWDGIMWNLISFATAPTTTIVGKLWYDPTAKQMYRWTGKMWEKVQPVGRMELDSDGNLRFISGTTGSTSQIYISGAGNLWNAQALTPLAMVAEPNRGTDPVSGVPTYLQQGVGTDGSQDERRQMIQRIKGMLGWPSVEVELTKEQMDIAIDMSLEVLRTRSSSAYKRGYFALQLHPRVQKYKLTDATVGFNKIVDIYYVYRSQATFLGTAQGNSVYGQMAVQQLFNMGKFDLLSYHMVSSYIKTMQQLFAAEIQFTWDERERQLWIMKDFTVPEQVIVDATIERTEQDLLTDRGTRNWLQMYATAQCRYMLADIRGKFSTLPGAGGGISLNSSDLRQKADAEVMQCMDDLDNFIANDKVNVGLASDFVLG